MKRLALALLALTACEQPRTEIMFGVVTDIRAPNLIDSARLVVTRAKDGFVQQDISWELSGVPNQPFNLPGSYGVYSDGEEVKLDVVLTGMKGPNDVLNRRAVMNLVEGKTLFFRMSLVAGCQDRTDCLATQSCVEGVCRDVNIVSEQLPDFEPMLVDHLTCNSGTNFIDTSTGASLPMAAGAEDCPAHLCVDGTCLKPPPEPEAGSRPVTGYQYTNYVEASKTTNVAEDLSATSIAALVPQSDGTFSTIQGRGNPDGSFVINSVPNGEYYLRVGNKYFVTQSDSFDLTSPVAGRPDQKPAAASSTINLTSVTNLAPWTNTDILEVVAPSADTWWFELQATYPITPSATQLSNYAFTSGDAAGNGAPNLILATDPVAITQLQTKTDPVSSLPYTAQTKFALLPAFMQADGGTNNIGAFVMTDAPQTSMIDAPFRAGEWDSFFGWNGTNLTALNPAARHFAAGDGYGVYAHAQVGGALYGQFSATQDFMYAVLPHGQDSPLSGLSFGTMTPPGQWATLVTVDLNAGVFYNVPGATQMIFNRVGVRQNALLSTLTPSFFSPSFGPVRAPLIDGRDLFQDQTTQLSTTPTISWQVPAVGKPSLYEVVFFELGVAGGTGKTTVATFMTTGTSIVVPIGILQVGHYYALQINATTTPNAAAPYRQRLPSARSSIASALFVPTMEGKTGSGIDPGPVGDAGTGSGSGGGGPLDSGMTMTCTPGGAQCSNCIDDDTDGKIDLQDPECLGPSDNSESVL